MKSCPFLCILADFVGRQLVGDARQKVGQGKTVCVEGLFTSDNTKDVWRKCLSNLEVNGQYGTKSSQASDPNGRNQFNFRKASQAVSGPIRIEDETVPNMTKLEDDNTSVITDASVNIDAFLMKKRRMIEELFQKEFSSLRQTNSIGHSRKESGESGLYSIPELSFLEESMAKGKPPKDPSMENKVKLKTISEEREGSRIMKREDNVAVEKLHEISRRLSTYMDQTLNRSGETNKILADDFDTLTGDFSRENMLKNKPERVRNRSVSSARVPTGASTNFGASRRQETEVGEGQQHVIPNDGNLLFGIARLLQELLVNVKSNPGSLDSARSLPSTRRNQPRYLILQSFNVFQHEPEALKRKESTATQTETVERMVCCNCTVQTNRVTTSNTVRSEVASSYVLPSNRQSTVSWNITETTPSKELQASSAKKTGDTSNVAQKRENKENVGKGAAMFDLSFRREREDSLKESSISFNNSRRREMIIPSKDEPIFQWLPMNAFHERDLEELLRANP
eukprot:TRINITY_DN3784_c0_g1_i2.p1 TRINITY_DN3784_c0_g1~~TRINITY_DN3784_c0_g1_i2.p1  ORF type:complete len:511 (-),score=85.61 TRINITY_DN3784_c0_g1_i2:82-1614(-)